MWNEIFLNFFDTQDEVDKFYEKTEEVFLSLKLRIKKAKTFQIS